MSWNLFSKELKRNAYSLITWMLIITLLITLTMSVYPTFLKNQSQILGMFSIIPKEALQFKGISDINALLSVLGFYAANNVIYMMVLGSIYAIVLASNILLKEEYNKTAEYLLTRPLTRSEIFVSKLGIIILNVMILNLVTSVAGLICLELFKTGPFSVKAFAILSIYTLLLNFLFGTIGLFVSTLMKRARPITSFCIGIVLFFYFIYTISKITTSIAKIGYLSPFRFVNLDAINPAYKLNFWHLCYFLGISVILILLSHYFYKRKDIYT